jgi:hypothetical protein
MGSAPLPPLPPLTLTNLSHVVMLLLNNMNQLSQEVQTLTQLVGQGQPQVMAQTSSSLGKIVAHPWPWDGKGDSAAAWHFLVAFSNWAFSQKGQMNVELANGQWHHRDMDWIHAILNLMSGKVRTWALPTLEELRDGRDPYRGVWQEFEEQFTCWFIPLDLAQAACEALKKLKQGKLSMAEYKAKFDEQSALTKWSLINLRTRFYDRLSDNIKDTLAITNHPIETLHELFESAQIVDMRMHQWQAEKKGQTFHQQGGQAQGVVPMEVDATCQQQGNKGKGAQPQPQSGSGGKNQASWMKQMAGKCFGCRISDHTKKAGSHDQEICHHCQKAGHHANVCFDKYMGKEKKAKAASTETAAATAPSVSSTPAPSSASQANIIRMMMEQQKELAAQLEALKSSF